MAGAVAVIGLVVGVAGTARSISEGKKSAKAQREGLRIQQEQQAVSVRRQRAQTRRASRAARAEALSTAQGQTGSVSGSGIAGATASIFSQAGANISFLDTQEELTNRLVGARLRGVDAQSTAATYGALADIGGSIFSAAGGYESIFGA